MKNLGRISWELIFAVLSMNLYFLRSKSSTLEYSIYDNDGQLKQFITRNILSCLSNIFALRISKGFAGIDFCSTIFFEMEMGIFSMEVLA